MQFVADEGVDGPIVDRLRADGHEVDYVAEMDPGLDDATILRRANEANALLITADKDQGRECPIRSGRVQAPRSRSPILPLAPSTHA